MVIHNKKKHLEGGRKIKAIVQKIVLSSRARGDVPLEKETPKGMPEKRKRRSRASGRRFFEKKYGKDKKGGKGKTPSGENGGRMLADHSKSAGKRLESSVLGLRTCEDEDAKMEKQKKRIGNRAFGARLC